METPTNQPPTNPLRRFSDWYQRVQPVKSFINWYQQQGLILFLLLLPIVIVLWLIAVAKYFTLKIWKGINRNDYIRTN